MSDTVHDLAVPILISIRDKLTTMSDPAGMIGFTYDERGNVTKETRIGGGVTTALSTAYDAAGRIAGSGKAVSAPPIKSSAPGRARPDLIVPAAHCACSTV